MHSTKPKAFVSLTWVCWKTYINTGSIYWIGDFPPQPQTPLVHSSRMNSIRQWQVENPCSQLPKEAWPQGSCPFPEHFTWSCISGKQKPQTSNKPFTSLCTQGYRKLGTSPAISPPSVAGNLKPKHQAFPAWVGQIWVCCAPPSAVFQEKYLGSTSLAPV